MIFSSSNYPSQQNNHISDAEKAGVVPPNKLNPLSSLYLSSSSLAAVPSN